MSVTWLALGGEAHAQRTAADIESARQLYNQGIELRDRGDLKNALEKFRAAHALGNTPITGIELCKTYAALKQPVEAREVCLGVARIAPLAQETSRSQDARNEAGKIAEEQRPKIGSLKLKIEGVPAGREPTVTVDGVAVPPAALNEPRAVNPGVHVVTARVGGGAETRATLEMREGEQRDLEIAVQPPPPEQPPPSSNAGGAKAPRPAEKKKSPLATAGFVVGGIAAGIGAISGLVAISSESELEDKCGASKACGSELHGDLDAARTWATVSTVSFVIAGIGFATGFIATVSASSKSASLPLPRTAQAKGASFGVGLGGIHGSF